MLHNRSTWGRGRRRLDLTCYGQLNDTGDVKRHVEPVIRDQRGDALSTINDAADGSDAQAVHPGGLQFVPGWQPRGTGDGDGHGEGEN